MVTAACLAMSFALSIFFLVPIHPSHVGLVIEDMTEDEMLVATAFENKDIFDKVIKDENAEEGRKSTVEAKVAELKNTNEFDQLKNSVVTSSQAKQRLQAFKLAVQSFF